MIGHQLEGADVLIGESFRGIALHIQHANNFVFHLQRQGHLRARLRQVGVVEPGCILSHVEDNARFARGGDKADDARLPHLQAMSTRQHALPPHRGSGTQDGPHLSIVKDENAHVVEAEPF